MVRSVLPLGVVRGDSATPRAKRKQKQKKKQNLEVLALGGGHPQGPKPIFIYFLFFLSRDGFGQNEGDRQPPCVFIFSNFFNFFNFFK
jgi:hypothetical protein